MSSPEFKEIQVSDLEVKGTRMIDMDHVLYLARSIKERGFLYYSPLTVQKKEEKLLVLDGAHRVFAALLAGVDKLPCVIVDWDDQKVEEFFIVSSNVRSLVPRG